MKSKKEFIKENDIKTRQGRDTFLSLANQVDAEYKLAWKHQNDKKKEWELRLRLYNNQRRDKSAVGDNTLFTIHQTILASLYVDKLNVVFEGREEGDEETAENLNIVAKHDYSDMGKDVIDYEWIWDAAFFGRGFVALDEFERDPDNNLYLPIPRVLDPITLLRDPYASSVNGDRRGRGAARFFGYEVKMTRSEIEAHPHLFDEIKLDDLKGGSEGSFSVLDSAIQARNDAQGLQSPLKDEAEHNMGDNTHYTLTEWYTNYDIDGKVQKVKVWLANDRGKVVGIQKLGQDEWTVIDRPLYPTSHDWDGTSIPDLVEDKQRARAVAQNLGLDYMRADLYPTYVYDSTKIDNRKDLKFNFNKFIGIDGKGASVTNAIAPINKAQPNLNLLNFVMETLDLSAQKSTATPEIQQGIVSQQERTLGELNIVASKVDTRYSLSSKIFGWSEKRFWQQWYRMYKNNFEDKIDEKVIRIVGSFGAKWRPLKKDNIIARIDPDIHIESELMSRAKQMEERASLSQYLALVLQDPNANRSYGFKKLGRVSGLTKDEIDRLFPLTIDEREAQDENDILNEGKSVEVLVEQNHNAHLEMHARLNDSPEARAHIKTHEEALKIKRVRPDLFPTPEQSAAAAQTPPGSPQVMGQGLGLTSETASGGTPARQ